MAFLQQSSTKQYHVINFESKSENTQHNKPFHYLIKINELPFFTLELYFCLKIADKPKYIILVSYQDNIFNKLDKVTY